MGERGGNAIPRRRQLGAGALQPASDSISSHSGPLAPLRPWQTRPPTVSCSNCTAARWPAAGQHQATVPVLCFLASLASACVQPVARLRCNRLAFGRADRVGLFLPLAVDLGLLGLHVVEQHALPQALVEVVQRSSVLGLSSSCSPSDLGRLLALQAGGVIEESIG